MTVVRSGDCGQRGDVVYAITHRFDLKWFEVGVDSDGHRAVFARGRTACMFPDESEEDRLRMEYPRQFKC